ncbi:MAG: hypothetical protein RIB03_03240 [Henriciella sp.]|uniref:hypothetical protein n=1 Tax=Henriciella sp. TaxID=1968823 RepID=UPI0032ED150E
MTDNPLEGRSISRIPLKRLLLDPSNPRFGFREKSGSQAEILDHIVEKFGVNDVLSSLAVNGYFEAEPVVCRENGDNFVVVEGNRRLAACLILAGDPRAANQATRAHEFQTLWKKNGSPVIDPVPAISFSGEESKKEILSYLGVRHIAASQPWDSYAKAAWVAQVVENSGLSIADVSQMIGDRHNTVNRLLEGYYLIDQLVEEGVFNPDDSVRRGRGSVTEYPFSWVYTTLGYKAVRNYLELDDGSAKPRPLSEEALEKGALVVKSLFGDKSKGRNSAIDDSRQIGDLASAFASTEKVVLLKEGHSLDEIIQQTKPIEERLSEGLRSARTILRDLVSGISENDLEAAVAAELIPLSGGTRKLAVDLDRRLKNVVTGDEDDDA